MRGTVANNRRVFASTSSGLLGRFPQPVGQPPSRTTDSTHCVGHSTCRRRSSDSWSRRFGQPQLALSGWSSWPAVKTGSPAARNVRWSSENWNPNRRSTPSSSASVSPGWMCTVPNRASRCDASTPTAAPEPITPTAYDQHRPDRTTDLIGGGKRPARGYGVNLMLGGVGGSCWPQAAPVGAARAVGPGPGLRPAASPQAGARHDEVPDRRSRQVSGASFSSQHAVAVASGGASDVRDGKGDSVI